MTTTDWFPHATIALGFVNSKTGEIAALYPHGGWYVAPKGSKADGDELETYLRKAMVAGFTPAPAPTVTVQDPYSRALGTVDSLSITIGQSHQMAIIPQALRDIAANLATQDSQMTNNPIFLVQKKVRQTGLDTDYSDNHIWIDHANDYMEVTDPKEIERLEELDEKWPLTKDEEEERNCYLKTGYVDRWETVQPFFTEVEADRFIAANRHRHDGELRIYVEWGGRNPEWMAIRNFLLSLNPSKQSTTT